VEVEQHVGQANAENELFYLVVLVVVWAEKTSLYKPVKLNHDHKPTYQWKSFFKEK